MRVFGRISIIAGVGLMCLMATSELLACKVPVFRYAIERWEPDRYRVVVLHDGPLDAKSRLAAKTLHEAGTSSADRASLIDVDDVDLAEAGAEGQNGRLLRIWKQRAEGIQSMMLVYYPTANEVGLAGPLYLAELTSENVASLLDSPLRRQLAQHLSGGDSAVWIFVPCGREKDDQEARKRLEEQLASDTTRLELPSAKELEVDPAVLKETKIPLRIAFSVVTLDREDKAERFVLESLLNSEDDLKGFDQPLAFPVFGRGRVLYGLVGKGIGQDMIRTASTFMVGPCSCQVKNQNPGFDLLLQSDWSKALGDKLISEPIDKPDKEGLGPTLLTIPPGRKSR